MEASTVLGDAVATTIPDSSTPSGASLRHDWDVLGEPTAVVSYIDLEESVRILSARTATAQERRRYESRT
jgi:uncharacterized DUF497 family protein